MNGTIEEAKQLTQALTASIETSKTNDTHVVVCPPSLHISTVLELAGDSLKVGGQDCSAEAEGAHTGDITARMLQDAGALYVILGHSERRADHKETSFLIAKKAERANAAGLKPIICIGETLEDRESGRYETILAQQLKDSVPDSFSSDDYIIAYEPVWAIGTGKTADAQTIRQTHQFIAGQPKGNTALLYGGSVKPANAAEILAIDHVHGVLVGGASLDAESFTGIIEATPLALAA